MSFPAALTEGMMGWQRYRVLKSLATTAEVEVYLAADPDESEPSNSGCWMASGVALSRAAATDPPVQEFLKARRFGVELLNLDEPIGGELFVYHVVPPVAVAPVRKPALK